MIIAIVGAPGSGKSTLAAALTKGLTAVLHTDDYIELAWANQARAAVEGFQRLQPQHSRIVVEGVTVQRMFRLGFRPDLVLECTRPGRPTPALTAGLDRARAECAAAGIPWVRVVP